jgi:hypothetical protein
MARAKRADHRTGTEGPRWSPGGTADDPAVGGPEWDPDDTEERRVLVQDDLDGQDPQPEQDHLDGQEPQPEQEVLNGQDPQPEEEVLDGQDPQPEEEVLDGQEPQPEQDVREGQDPPADGDAPSAQNGQSAGPEAAEWTREYEAAQRAHQQAGGQQPADFGTPVRVDEIALAAMALSNELHTATQGLSESVASRQFRRDLDEAADTFRSVANELETTAGNLVRLAANESRSCAVTWGVCPEHGLTLMNVGEVVTCHVLGCHRENEGAVERCTQPVAYKVVDAAGPALFTCSGHAIACRLHFEGAVITLASDSLEVL